MNLNVNKKLQSSQTITTNGKPSIVTLPKCIIMTKWMCHPWGGCLGHLHGSLGWAWSLCGYFEWATFMGLDFGVIHTSFSFSIREENVFFDGDISYLETFVFFSSAILNSLKTIFCWVGLDTPLGLTLYFQYYIEPRIVRWNLCILFGFGLSLVTMCVRL